MKTKKPTILGISKGGMIAQQYAVSYPEDISHLILMNPVIAGDHSIATSPFASNAILHMPENSMQRYMTGMRLLAPPRWWVQIAYSIARDHFPDDKTSFLINENILNGGADALIPPSNSEILAHTIPHATLIRWQDGGHAMIYQYPEQIAQTINEFLI